MVKIAPSILASDFSNLREDCQRAVDAGADMLHIDVMDGVFVPNISIGPAVLKSLSKKVDTYYDVHLMITEPKKYLEAFQKSGADSITVHLESKGNTTDTLQTIKDLGCKAGLCIKPATDVKEVFPYLSLLDTVLIMTVEPGFGGQSFMAQMLPKIKELREYLDKKGLTNVEIQVDGGINQETAGACIKNGATVLVAGSSVFQAENYKEAIGKLRNAEEVLC